MRTGMGRRYEHESRLEARIGCSVEGRNIVTPVDDEPRPTSMR
jgi:hypothetical protein